MRKKPFVPRMDLQYRSAVRARFPTYIPYDSELIGERGTVVQGPAASVPVILHNEAEKPCRHGCEVQKHNDFADPPVPDKVRSQTAEKSGWYQERHPVMRVYSSPEQEQEGGMSDQSQQNENSQLCRDIIPVRPDAPE